MAHFFVLPAVAHHNFTDFFINIPMLCCMNPLCHPANGGEHTRRWRPPLKGELLSTAMLQKGRAFVVKSIHATNHCNATNDEDHLMIPCFFSLRSTWSLFPLEITAMKQTLVIGFLFIWCLALKAMVFATIWSNYIQVPLLLVGLKTISGSVSLHIVKCRRCRGGSKNGSKTQSWLLSRWANGSFSSGWFRLGVEENKVCKTSTKQILIFTSRSYYNMLLWICCKMHISLIGAYCCTSPTCFVGVKTWVFCYYRKQVDVYKLRASFLALIHSDSSDATS